MKGRKKEEISFAWSDGGKYESNGDVLNFIKHWKCAFENLFDLP